MREAEPDRGMINGVAMGPPRHHPVVGRMAIIGSDHRYCASSNRTAGAVTTNGAWYSRSVSRACGVAVHAPAAADAFWWITAALNAAWARQHGYDHLLYCVTACAHIDSGELRWTAWCKIVVMADALELGERYDSLLFMDSDAYWKKQNISVIEGLVDPWTEGTWAQYGLVPRHEKRNSPAVYFGCNSPWEDCGTLWNFSAVHAGNGSANSGVVLLRNTKQARLVLREWWHARDGRAKQHAWRRPA